MGGIYWLASYPKSGSTWFRAFVQNLRADGETPVDINEIQTGLIAGARGWIDDVLGFDTADLTDEEVDRLRPHVYRWSAREGDIGYHKIHDAYTRLPDGEPLASREGTLGALYIVRNPLDVVASFANHMGCTIDEAIAKMGDPNFQMARRGGLFHQARQRLLSWSGHVASWIDSPELRREVVRYEDMLFRPRDTFTRAARFLELPHDAPASRRPRSSPCSTSSTARKPSTDSPSGPPSRRNSSAAVRPADGAKSSILMRSLA